MTTAVEFDVWKNNAPVADNGNPEFAVWLNGAPVVDNSGEENNLTNARRRVFIF